MMASSSGASSSSLVEQIREQHLRAEAQRRANRRKARIRWFLLTILVGALASVTVFVSHHFALERLMAQRVIGARNALASLSIAELESAGQALEANLVTAPTHPESLGLLALIRARQGLAGTVNAADVERAIQAAAEAGTPEAGLAKAMMAARAGDLETVRAAYVGSDRSTSPGDPLRQERAWLQGVVALAHPYVHDEVRQAQGELLAVLEVEPKHTANRRIAAALSLRLGEGERALQIIDEGRKLDDTHVGLSVEEMLTHAMLGRKLEGVDWVATSLLELPELAPIDRSYVHLAQVVAEYRLGRRKEARALLESAWATLPQWDGHARDLGVDVALSHADRDVVETWLKTATVPDFARQSYEAWFLLISGDTRACLERLAKLPQDEPNVATLQALALTEQERWPEAQRWADFAKPSVGHRLDLRVAVERIRVQQGTSDGAAERLEAIAELDGYAWRVWTAVAEARRAQELEGIEAALDHAIEREPVPAKALLIKAQRSMASIVEHPEQALSAKDLLVRAVEVDPYDPRYRVHLARHLLSMGQRGPAITALRAATDPNLGLTDGSAFVDLVVLLCDQATEASRPASAEAAELIGRAAQTPIERWQIDLAWAAYEASQATPESLASAQNRLAGVLQAAPTSLRARMLLSSVMRARRDPATKAILRDGLRVIEDEHSGELVVELARLEDVEGNTRRAASLGFKGWRQMFADGAASPEAMLKAAGVVARFWVNIQQPNGARSIARELTQRVPYSADAWVLRGQMEFLDGKEAKGCEAAEHATQIEPTHAAARALLADCHAKRLEFQAAREAYAQAAELASDPGQRELYRRKSEHL